MNGRTPWRALQLGCVLALLVGLLGMPGVPTARSLANDLSAPTRVTVPGNLGSELGCTHDGGDWQPSCNGAPGSIPNTPDPLQGNDLVNVGNGVWAREHTSLPSGNYEYKVALNGDWAINYGADFQRNGPNFALSLPPAFKKVRFYYDHKTHYVATYVLDSLDNSVANTIYTVPGNFNGALGCSGDWQPECLRTFMSDADRNGIFTFVTDQIPAGSYEFKVATNESWSNPNYGANGGGNNIPFTVSALGVAVTFSFNTVTNVPSVEVANPPPAEDAALIRAPVSDPENQDEIFYFVMPDRFANGNPANDTGGVAGGALANGFLPSDKGYYHGGDLAGLLNKLDYLEDLGVTAIWMTPMFKNKPVQGDGTIAGSSAAYHGYWPVDFTQIDPHFGTNAEMKGFIAAAQARGMRVFFDIITNHTADVIRPEGNPPYSYIPRSDAPYRDAGGNIIDDRDYLFADAFPPLNRYSFPRKPTFPTPADATVKVPAWLNDPTMYHNRGEAAFDNSEGDIYGDFVGLDGLFTERPEVVQGMVDIHKFWIEEFGIDGFRVDTVKHVNMEFWQQFVPEIREFAASQGKPEFFIFGEIFSGDPAYMSQFTREGQFPATLDFDFNYSGQDFAVGSAGPSRLQGLFRGDDYYTSPTDNAYNQPTFLGNHDIGRIGNRMQFISASLPDIERRSRMLLGYGLMFTARGVPIIYYGDEQGFTGDGNDKDARQSLFASQVGSYNDDDLIGTNNTTAVDNYNTNHPLYQGLRQLAELRKDNPALQNGAQIERLVEDGGAGVYAFSRIDRDAKVEYVVALNNAEQARAVEIQTFAASGAEFQQIYPETGSVNANSAGRISLNVPPLGMVVYKQTAANPGNPGGSPIGPKISFASPLNGTALVSGLVEVAANVSGAPFAEVSFAASVNGGAYTHLGTDTNAPYRVFYDTNKLPAGASVSFKAVVTDLLGAPGNFNSATTTATLAVAAVCTVDYEYAVVHYNRPDGNYDGWTVYPFGDGVTEPDYNTGSIPFLGRTEYGAFAWIKLDDPTKPLGIVIHNNADGSDEKDPGPDLFFTPKDTPQAFIKSGDTTVYPSQAAAQGYVTFHYNGPADAVLYVFGDGAAPGERANSYPGNRTFNGQDAYGRFVRVQVGDPTKPMGFIVIKADGTKDPSPDRFITPANQPSAWLKTGDERVYRSLSEAQNVVTLRYHRPNGDYGDYSTADPNDDSAFTNYWGLHTWAGTKNPNPKWQQPFLPISSPDSFGVTFRTELADNATTWAYILHKGDAKDKPTDQFLDLAGTGHEIWILQEMPGEYPYLLPVQPGCTLGQGNITGQQRAHWVSENTLAWPIVASQQIDYTLHYAPNGGLSFANGQVQGGMSVPLSLNTDGIGAEASALFPHLADLTALTIDASPATIKNILKGQIWVSASTDELGVVEATGVQIPGVLDDLYAAGARGLTLGPDVSGVTGRGSGTIKLRLWAPTAQSVSLLRYANETTATSERVAMSLDSNSGVWTASLPASAMGSYYLYEVKVYVPSTGRVETNVVTDPYSVSLAMNSRRSQIVDLNARALKPGGWDTLKKPQLDAFEDIVLYELHVRDFSITDETVPEALRGTFAAFTQSDSAGMTHLRELAKDGLTHVHLLPAFDIATINEDKAARTEILPRFAELAAMPPDGLEQQEIAHALRDQDGFNWGYDPFHYNVPEGSYSTNPNGITRIVEFRDMVRTLNRHGLRVVMDVVYNHTSGSGQGSTSVLDRVVPGYYHRLNDKGQIETSTCCANTATEHAMMEKLMVDSLVLWAKAYKVDGFRFDLMGHHMKRNMLEVREALDSLTLAKDGVDGKKIYVYGEGWNFGEVADGRRGVNATQRNMAGTGIGTFSDRLRDAVRGGGPFDSGEDAKKQGFINGLFYDPNDYNQGTPADQRAALLRAADMIRVGMAGNLASFVITNSLGNVVRGEDVDYNGSPGGYTQDPQEVITYIEAHDNETLFDANQLKVPVGTSLADRVRVHNLGLSIVMLGQGVPFIQAGQEFLRSKSGDRNSFNSGDWFNRVDWELQDHNWGSGLPVIEGRAPNAFPPTWQVLQPLLANPALKPGNAEMVSAYQHVRELLRIRKSSQLFRLRTAAEVEARLSYLNQGQNQIPGLIVMQLRDDGAQDLDKNLERIVVLINAGDQPVSFTAAELKGLRLRLHQVQRESHDPVVRTSSYASASGTFTIPARTTAVFTDAAGDN